MKQPKIKRQIIPFDTHKTWCSVDDGKCDCKPSSKELLTKEWKKENR